MQTLLNQAHHINTTKVGLVKSRQSVPYLGRVNIENLHQLSSAGLVAGEHYRVTTKRHELQIITDPTGQYVVSPKNFKRRDGTVKIGSRVDVRLRALMTDCEFPDPTQLVVYYLADRLIVMPRPSEINNSRRLANLAQDLTDKTIRSAALYSGYGSLDAALHEGFERHGLHSELQLANDVWAPALNALFENNPAATKKTRTLNLGIEQLCAMGTSPFKGISLLTAGILCKGASKLNVATRDLPETHPIAGHQVLNFVMLLQAMQWDVPLILVENVTDWSNTISYSMLKRVFEEQGYQVALIGENHEGKYKGINARDYGEMERRSRMAMLAYPKGISLDLAYFDSLRTGAGTKTVADIRLPEAEVDPGEYAKGAHLDSAHKRAKGWRNRIVSNDDTSTPSLSADCWKQRIEDPKFPHPTQAGQSRLPLPEEHAALKGQPVDLINALAFNSHAHTALGNGVARKPWVALAEMLSRSLLAWHTAQTAFTPH